MRLHPAGMLHRPAAAVRSAAPHPSMARSASSSAGYLPSKSSDTTSTGKAVGLEMTKVASLGAWPSKAGRMGPQSTKVGEKEMRGLRPRPLACAGRQAGRQRRGRGGGVSAAGRAFQRLERGRWPASSRVPLSPPQPDLQLLDLRVEVDLERGGGGGGGAAGRPATHARTHTAARQRQQEPLLPVATHRCGAQAGRRLARRTGEATAPRCPHVQQRAHPIHADSTCVSRLINI